MLSQYILHPSVKVVFITSGPQSHFFGYYDKSPLDSSERFLLSHRVEFDGRMASADDIVELGVWDITDGTYRTLSNTNAFNWQIGSMLQWLPGSNDSKVIFNDIESHDYVSKIIDIYSGSQKLLPTTIYSISPDGDLS